MLEWGQSGGQRENVVGAVKPARPAVLSTDTEDPQR